MTEEEWAEIDKRIAAWEKWRLEKAAQKAKAAAEKITQDARVDPDDLRKPTDL